MKNLSTARKVALSALTMALYVAVMAVSRGFAFGRYQIRIATALYALNGLFPFLAVPLGAANLLSNALLGGLGPLDMIGGAVVGTLTGLAVAAFRRSPRAPLAAALAITFIPGLGVPVWLSFLLRLPYPATAAGVLFGQAISGACGGLLLSALKKRFAAENEKEDV